MTLPSTTKRVQLSTKDTVNAAINQKTQSNITSYLNRGEPELTRRIEDLNEEWDTERILETSASSLVLLTLGLGFIFNQFWYMISAFTAFFLLIHALLGWCPPLPIIRRLGVRTETEICEEKTALKQLRGDFNGNSTNDPETLLRHSRLT